MSFQQLQCPVQHYAWGERVQNGKIPFIAQLQKQPPEDKPWAELWIGAHEAHPALLPDGASLARYLAENPAELGIPQTSKLPYLLKILCCSEPLSIQSHPSRAKAAELHRLFPKEFPDDNHKPEILFALSTFQMLGGFRKLLDIDRDLSEHLSCLTWRMHTGSIRELCQALFQMPDTLLEKMQNDLLNETAGSLQPRDCLFRRLSAKYPGDAGCFFAYLLNLVTLSPGEAVFIPANTPHAYLKGEGVECMANSDNVIRAGLTPKTIRKDLLMDTLDFTPLSPEELKLPPSADATREFAFSCQDFHIEIHNGMGEYQGGKATLFLVLDEDAQFFVNGKSFPAPCGSAWFAGAGSAVSWNGKRIVRVC